MQLFHNYFIYCIIIYNLTWDIAAITPFTDPHLLYDKTSINEDQNGLRTTKNIEEILL